ncbi:MAG: cyanophycinase [Bacteroidales bacterium]|jgi:cyanophycinase|nr:cyanophycinase [Bacteroidales bacterium]
MKRIAAVSIAVLLLGTACVSPPEEPAPAGKLYIIGGGSRPVSMLYEIVELSKAKDNGYMFVLPMANANPDSTIVWTRENFSVTGLDRITGYNFNNNAEIPAGMLDSLRNAKLIYIPGGVQTRFMNAISNTPIAEAIMEAYHNGAVIAGTSAGAAVMSAKMITGGQLKNPHSDEGYTTIESGNIETAAGLGLIPDVIVDQHFIRRQRMNRLVSLAIENPGDLCAGIDESTAIIIEGDMATVTGLGQVVVIRNKTGESTVNNGLLGSKEMEMSVYLPGDQFIIR